MRILVTGGAGFIGSNHIHWLLHDESSRCCADGRRYPPPADVEAVLNLDAMTYAANASNLDGVSTDSRYAFTKTDLADAGAVDRVVADFEPDAIIHYAAESHVDRSIEAGDVFVRSNVLGTQNLLDAARRHDVDAIVHVSTDEVYGSTMEGSFTEDSPLRPSSPYSASKAGSDLLAFAHHHTYGLPVAVTRCTNNYGPRQHAEKLLPKMIARARAGERLPIYGSGKQVRDWLYVKDHCVAVHHVLGLGRWGDVFNVAAQDERTNLDVVGKILEATSREATLVQHVEDRLGHDFRYSLDDGKLRATGWRPRTTFKQGFKATLAWYGGDA